MLTRFLGCRNGGQSPYWFPVVILPLLVLTAAATVNLILELTR